MIASMRDLDAVDQQLRALGEPPAGRASLLARVLGEDRSLARLEQLLEQLGASAPRSAPPPAAADVLAAAHVAAAGGTAGQVAGDPQSSDVDLDDRQTDPDDRRTEDMLAAEAAAMMVALSRDTLPDRSPQLDGLASGDEPPAAGDEDEEGPEMSLEAAPSGVPSAEQDAPVPVVTADGERGGFAAMFDFTQPPPARDAEATDVTPSPWAVAPELDAAASSGGAAPESAREARADEEPTGRRTMPPDPAAEPATAAAADDDSDAEEADFELLVEDEEIMEIDDEELQIVDDE
jgi:hypothetical protein